MFRIFLCQWQISGNVLDSYPVYCMLLLAEDGHSIGIYKFRVIALPVSKPCFEEVNYPSLHNISDFVALKGWSEQNYWSHQRNDLVRRRRVRPPRFPSEHPRLFPGQLGISTSLCLRPLFRPGIIVYQNNVFLRVHINTVDTSIKLNSKLYPQACVQRVVNSPA